MEKNLLNSKLLNNASSLSTESDEYLLNSENNRLTIYPIKDTDIWNAYLRQLASFWTAGELDFSKDYDDYKNKLNTNEQYFIKMILAFFSSADTIVNINLGERFLKDVKIREAIVCYDFQKMIENIHCVSADTKILTDTGYYEIEKLLNKNVKVWNGKFFSDTIVKYTGDSELYEIILSNQMVLKCTPNHKWFIRPVKQSHSSQDEKNIIFTKDLKLNDIINNYDLPILDIMDPDNFLNPYIHGFFCGNDDISDNCPMIYLYEPKKKLLKYFDVEKYTENTDSIQFYILNKINKEKFEVPINYSLNTKIKWLEGLFDSVGYVLNKKKHISFQITSINLSFLKNVQLMLNTMGINPEIKEQSYKECIFEPNNKDNAFYKMYIKKNNLLKLLNFGFNSILLEKIDANYKNTIPLSKNKLLKITNIRKLEGIYKTFCFNEEKEHSGIFNGILTGQSEVYSLQIENIIKDPEEKERLFNAVEHFECIAEKANWALEWIESDENYAHRLIAFAIMEGVFFSGSFCAIYWLKKRNIMPGLCASNELIARDEGEHCLAKGTLVSIDGYMSVPIEELIDNENKSKILSYDDKRFGMCYNNQSKFKYQGKQKCIELFFEDGRSLKCTPEHKILTTVGWKEASEIEINKDKILMTIENPRIVKTDHDINEENRWQLTINDKYIFSTKTPEDTKKACAFVRILGYILTNIFDGYSWKCILLIKNKIDAENIQNDVKLAFGEILDNAGIEDGYYTVYRGGYYTVCISSIITKLVYEFQNILILKNGLLINDYLPKFILSAPRIIIANFLAGLFSNNKLASVPINKDDINIDNKLSLYFGINEHDAKLYQKKLLYLLSKFNINAYPIQKYFPLVKKYKYSIIIALEDIQKFYKNIGFAYNINKQLILAFGSCVNNLQNQIKIQNDFITGKFNEISKFSQINEEADKLNYTGSAKVNYINNKIEINLDEIYKLSIKSWTDNNPCYGYIKSSTSIIDTLINKTHDTLPSLNEKELLKSWNVYNWFSNDDNKSAYLSKKEVIPCYEQKVIYKKDAGELDTYDITVDDTHNFTANGVVVHNCSFAVLLYSKLKNKVSVTEVHNMFLGAVEIETKFICKSLPCSLLGMNSDLMTQYIKYVADRLLVDLGYSKLWNVTNPFDFMESISLEGKKNFFEGRPTQYQKASVFNKTKDDACNFTNNF